MSTYILVQDNFAEASNITLASHVPSTHGNTWQRVLTSGLTTNTLRVNGTNDNVEVETTGDSQGVGYAATPVPTSPNYYVELKITAIGAASDDAIWIILRLQPDGQNFYALRASSGFFALYKVIANSPSLITSSATHPTTNDTIKFEIIENHIKAYINGTAYITQDNSEITGAGIPVVCMGQLLVAGDDLAAQTLDDVVIGEYKETVTAKARIIQIAKPLLYSPADNTSGEQTTYFEWYLPYSKSNIQSALEISTVSNFASIEDIKQSWIDSGFEYWDGDSWETYPSDGVPRTFAGNLARIQVAIPTGGTKYWRVRCFAN